ncbi:MAG: Trm112 family protein [Actinomycetota bacterium]|nr:Trm112 family protein [Actinomycetota bacterium]MEE2680313.1 Trm112 family protein [Actinomycetota bacterium]MEE3186914.1 Trm112 family protein [Actinomycetota bacterium]|tara:strand:- start:3852 stop:4088 length:237 start_codon:yes stop_codon:yes gene_type:complete
MALDPELLEILACPDDKGTLRYLPDQDILYNPRLGRSYPIRDGIPVLLISESTDLDESERDRLNQLTGDDSQTSEPED